MIVVNILPDSLSTGGLSLPELHTAQVIRIYRTRTAHNYESLPVISGVRER